MDWYTLSYPPNIEAMVAADTAGRDPVPVSERLGVFLCFGQSLAGNHVQGLYQPGPGVQNLNIADGIIYRYVDPCLGATTTADGHMGWTGYGSIWGLLGDLLIERDLFDRVVFVTPAIGGTEIAKWAPGGTYHHRLLVALRRLVYAGLPLTAVLPMIGESDNALGTSAADYTASFRACIDTVRGFGFGCPWLVPLETLALMSVSPTLRAAQASLVDPSDRIFGGPDVDAYQGETYRYLEPGDQRGHLNAAGRDAVAADWAAAIEESVMPLLSAAIVRPVTGPQFFRRPRFIVDAATFDGTNDYLTRGAGLTGASDGKVGILSCWVNILAADGVRCRLLQGDSTAKVSVLRTLANKWVVSGFNAAGSLILFMQTSNTYTASSGWHHVYASWDLASGAGYLWINGADDRAASPTLTDDSVDLTSDDWIIGALAGGSQPMNCDIAELYFNIAAALDPATNILKFRRADGKPEFLGDDGSIPTGTAPIVYQRLQDGEAAASFAVNRGGGGGFTVTGALATAATSPSD